MALTYEEILEQGAAWLQPISASEPAGVSAKFDANYEALRAEIMKLESPRGEIVSWPAVVATGGEILSARSKDLLIAGHLAVAMYHERGFEGLAVGTVVITELMARFWDCLFPPLARIRARVGALEWFLEKAGLIVSNATAPTEKHRNGLMALKVAVERFRVVAAEKYGEHAPALTPLQDAVEKLIVCLPKPPAEAKPKPAPSPSTPVTSAPATGGAATESAPVASAETATEPVASTEPVVAASVPSAAGAVNRDEMVKFLQACSKSLVDTAVAVRQANPADAVAYRVLRVGMWLATLDAPAVGANGRTMIPALPRDLRAKLDKLVETRNWTTLLAETEGALLRSRLSLDLLRYSAQAMAALGDSYADARRMCIAELRNVLERCPGLAKLLMADGSPLADERTKGWIEEQVVASQGGGSGGGSSAPSIDDQAMAEINKLLAASQTAQALAIMERYVLGAGDGRSRAQLRLLQADLCRKAGASKIAAALYEALDAELTDMHMEKWEPELMVKVLTGRLSCLRAAKKPSDKPDDEHALYMRLAKLKPALALELGA